VNQTRGVTSTRALLFRPFGLDLVLVDAGRAPSIPPLAKWTGHERDSRLNPATRAIRLFVEFREFEVVFLGVFLELRH
jgi:hypothetical protein